MRELNVEVLENMVRECEDFIRLSENENLTNEDLEMMIDDLVKYSKQYKREI